METLDWRSQKRCARHTHDRASLPEAIQNV